MRIHKRSLNWSLRNSLILFLLTSLVFTVFALLASASVYRGVLRRNTGYTMALYATEQEKLLEEELQTIKTALYALVNKEEIIHYLGGNRGYKAANVTYVTSQLSDIPRYVPIISDVLIATPDGHVTASSFNNLDIINFLARRDILAQYYRMENTSAVTFSLAPGKESEYILAIAVPVQSATGVGIAIAFSTQADLLGGANFMTYPCTILSDDATLYSNASEMPDANALRAFAALPDQAPDGRNLIHLSLEAVGWDLFFEYPLSVVDSRLESSLTRWSVLSILIFALIEGLLILSIYKIIVAPILNISNQSTRITSTSNMLDNPAGGRNELNLLVRNINDMIVRTNLLTGEVKDAKLRLMQMDITRLQERNMFLQAQINPHFLYNMLECICGMSAQEGNYAVRDMTHLLSKLYQYSLRSPDSTLGEEFECVALYEKMMQLRYDAGYRITVDVAEDLLLLPLPRMSLEPIVENAVQHGFVRGGTQHFFVHIHAAFDKGMLRVLISDNGCGIAPERLAEIGRELSGDAFERVENSDHIGLNNVNARLRLRYEAGSGLTLAANADGGLDVCMQIRYSTEDFDTDSV